jgi:hypothetical protein
MAFYSLIEPAIWYSVFLEKVIIRSQWLYENGNDLIIAVIFLHKRFMFIFGNHVWI